MTRAVPSSALAANLAAATSAANAAANSAAASPTSPQAAAGGAAKPTHHGIRFGDVLSALNPLQYLPVVGMIYRAVTGDTIPESLRTFGSLVVSGLMGGPVGIVTSIATTIAEKATGIDPERIGHAVLADLGLAAPLGKAVASAREAARPVAAATPSAGPTKAPAVKSASAPAAGPGNAADLGWSAKALTTAGVTMAGGGIPLLGALRGADALNALELSRVRTAMAAYGRVGVA